MICKKAREIWIPSERILRQISKYENIPEDKIIHEIRSGKLSVLCSTKSSNVKDFKPVIIGDGSKPKVCVAIGMDSNSRKHFDKDELNIILNASPDLVCDVSIGNNITNALSEIRSIIQVPLGSCPTYDILNEKVKDELSKSVILERIETHLKTGIDFILIHFGFSKKMIDSVLKSDRVIPITSRGGGAVMRYMRNTGKENPFIEYFDDICELCRKYQVVLDLGDIFRSGCLEDGTHLTEITSLKSQEIMLLSNLQKRGLENGVQIVCEAGGHIPLDRIEKYVKWIKKSLNNSPVFFNGPLPTDRSVGLDSTSNAIGVAIAGMHGGNVFLALTDAEHYAKPTPNQSAKAIREVTAAVSAINYALGDNEEIQLNHMMGHARQDRSWQTQSELSLYPRISSNLFLEQGLSKDKTPCSLCGPLCPLLVNKDKNL